MNANMNKGFDTLYSLNSNGSIQQWTIYVQGNLIVKEYGQVGGKLQTTSDAVFEGKNIGKANETSAEEQASAEAAAQWKKKLKSGYTKTILQAKKGAVDSDFVAGGIEPMLAHKWRDHSSKIVFPAFVQPKLDGIRCIAMIHNGKCTLWSRTRKPIKSVPHIVTELERAFPDQTVVLDGELYNHTMHDQFEKIVSLVRKDEPDPQCKMVEYHVYDSVRDGTFRDRFSWLRDHEHLFFVPGRMKNIVILVDTVMVREEDDVSAYFTQVRNRRYEGAMIRNDAEYENKRSYGLQKIKEFDDDEFKIIGVEAGRGRMSDCAIFVCETKKGDEFRCKMEGSLDVLKNILNAPKTVIGKKLTIRYFGMTNGGIPRFPIGVSVRDYE